MPTRKRFSTNLITEDLLTPTRNSSNYSMSSLTHALGKMNTGRAGTEMTCMTAIYMASRTGNTTRSFANRDGRSTDDWGIDDFFPTCTCDGGRENLLTGNTRSRMTGQVAMMFSTVEYFVTRLVADVECSICLFAFVRTAEFLTFMSSTIHICFAYTLTDVLFTSFGNFFG